MLELTENAANKIKEVMESEEKADHGLRIIAQPGGCAGVQYGLEFTEEGTEQDTVVEAHGLKLFVDPNSATMLKGATVDFVENEHGAGFKVDNPNIQACDCSGSGGSC
jgi:iron-sulfur cluster assembly protein